MNQRDDCRLAADLIPWMAAGRADPGDKAWVYLHVAHCPDCRADLAHALALVHLARQAAEALPQADDELWARVAAGLESEWHAASEALTPGTGQTLKGTVALVLRTLGFFDQAGLPAAASARLRWALRWV